MKNKSEVTRKYVCAVCDAELVGKGEGLKTFTCSKHPTRMVTTPRDTSGGSEQLRDRRKEPVTVQRNTQVKVKFFQEVN